MGVLVVGVVLSVAGCGPTWNDEDVKAPDGHTQRLINCQHHFRCTQRAREVCPGGYVDQFGYREPHRMLITCTDGTLDRPTDWK